MLNEEVLKKVNQWITFADDDLQLARHGLTIPTKAPFRLIAFHAQQCVEKYLKALLVYKNIDFPYTHNISVLLELCEKHGNWTKEVKDGELLTPFAISSRYPGEDKSVTRDEAVNAVFIATNVRDIIRNLFIKEGLSL